MAGVAGTGNIWPNYNGKNTSAAAKNGNNLGKDEFLRILLTQISNQDPMQPLQDKEFIAQMAQFTSVEQLTNMAGEMKLLRQSIGIDPGIIGKSVSWTELDSAGKEIVKNGTVDALVMKNGLQYALVGDKEISLEKLTRISIPKEEA